MSKTNKNDTFPEQKNENLIRSDIEKIPNDILKILLKDHSTKKNILWGTDNYNDVNKQIKLNVIMDKHLDILRPRIMKLNEIQSDRTRIRAEVFTPPWLCNKMNNYLDEDWFGKKDIFNLEIEKGWETIDDKICFPNEKDWKEYVKLTNLEITCGEAPFITSRYDTTTGNIIPIQNRIGILDRKLRVVLENCETKEEWFIGATNTIKSVYGYDCQGDNLLIARINVFMTFIEYYEHCFNETINEIPMEILLEVATIISWNFWQMDGLKETTLVESEVYIMDWNKSYTIKYKDIKSPQGENGKKTMEFNYAIGNPPYQEEKHGDNNTFTPPIYHYFIDIVSQISNKSILITPARFLFNVGATPKKWNESKLNDIHFKVNEYWQNSKELFPDVEIKGGIAITYQDKTKDFGKMEIFISNTILNSILKKVKNNDKFESLINIVSSRAEYRFSKKIHEDNPLLFRKLSKGHLYSMSSNIFKLVPEIFFDEKPNDEYKYVQIYGKENNKRTYKWMREDWLNYPTNFKKYKVFVPSSNGSGAIGEILSTPLIGHPLIGYPLIGHTETFLSIGNFENIEIAENCMKYIKTKFARTMLGILKVTQTNSPPIWKYVPLQDFTENSDIDWSKSIPEIDQQLYKKYGLSEDEIQFIEEKVKEMM